MLTRRRFIALSAVAAGLAILPARHSLLAAEPLRWRGNALGADASLILYTSDIAEGRRLLARCRDELERLEHIFSLYRDDSTLVRLNHQGFLDDAPAELIDILSLSRHFSQRTDGAFDITVQPLWDLYARHFSQAGADPAGPSEAAVDALRPRLGWQGVRIDGGRISFARPGMEVTLNGIAQGYVTDRIAALLRRAGMTNVLVDMGEIRAIGSRPDGSPWRVGVEGADVVGLIDRAISTSSADGTRFSPVCNHLFDPKTGRCSQTPGTVSVIAPTSTVADALSTAVAVGGRQFGERIAADFPTASIIQGTGGAGTLVTSQ